MYRCVYMYEANVFGYEWPIILTASAAATTSQTTVATSAMARLVAAGFTTKRGFTDNIRFSATRLHAALSVLIHARQIRIIESRKAKILDQ